MRARYRKDVSPHHVGQRVTIRYQDQGPPQPGPTDVVGLLEAWADGELRVRRRNGEVVTVAEESILASRVIPPRPDRHDR